MLIGLGLVKFLSLGRVCSSFAYFVSGCHLTPFVSTSKVCTSKMYVKLQRTDPLFRLGDCSTKQHVLNKESC